MAIGASRDSILMAIGGMATRGNLALNEPNSSPSMMNCLLRRGQVEKRYPFRSSAIFKDGTGGTVDGQVGNLFVRQGILDTDYLIASGQPYEDPTTIYGDAHYLDGASWTAFSDVDIIFDAANYNGSIYMETGASTGGLPTRVVSWDGTTETNHSLVSRFSGRSIASFIGRLFVAGPVYPIDTTSSGGSYLYKFDDNTEWTTSGSWSQPVLANGVTTATFAHATNDKIKTTNAILTSAAAETYYTAQFWVQSASPSSSVPITVRLEDSAGTTIYGFAEYVIPTIGTDANWRQYIVQGRIPASTAVYLSLQGGNSGGDAPVGAKIRLSDRNDATAIPCAQIFPGRYAFPYYATTTAGTVLDSSLTNRVVWSEALDPTDWRNESYVVCDDSPGAITAVRAVNGKLVVFKANSIYTFRPTQSNVNPIVRENFLPGIGTQSPASVASFDNKLVFIAGNEVYVYDGTSKPKPICGDGMKDEILAGQLDGELQITVDEFNHELWVYTQFYKIFVYSMESNRWIGYLQFTDSTQSESPFGSANAGEVEGMVYFDGTVWVNVRLAGAVPTGKNTYSVCRQDSAETRDDVDGTERAVKAWYTFHPLETERPRKQITVQKIGLGHKITGDQTNSTTRTAVSLDGGATWVNYNQFRIYPLSSGADADTKILKVGVHQTAPKILFRIEHNGDAGPAYFNLSDGEAEAMLRGREVQYPNPTNGSSSL